MDYVTFEIFRLRFAPLKMTKTWFIKSLDIPDRGVSFHEKGSTMEETRKHLARAGAESLTLGILTLVFGVTVGVLNIVNGGQLLHQRKALK